MISLRLRKGGFHGGLKISYSDSNMGAKRPLRMTGALDSNAVEESNNPRLLLRPRHFRDDIRVDEPSDRNGYASGSSENTTGR